MVPSASTYKIWTKVVNLFLNNKASHAIALEVKFHASTQGDLLVLKYTQRLKDLADLEQPVNDSMLLLALLRGVSEPLHGMASIIKVNDLLPTFLDAQSLLAVEESELLSCALLATAFIAPKATPAAPYAPALIGAALAGPTVPSGPIHHLILVLTGSAKARVTTTCMVLGENVSNVAYAWPRKSRGSPGLYAVTTSIPPIATVLGRRTDQLCNCSLAWLTL